VLFVVLMLLLEGLILRELAMFIIMIYRRTLRIMFIGLGELLGLERVGWLLILSLLGIMIIFRMC